MSANTGYESQWISRILTRPKGWPANAILMFVAGVMFFTAMTPTGALSQTLGFTLGFTLLVLAIGESVPAERPTLANLIRIGGTGAIVLVAVIVGS